MARAREQLIVPSEFALGEMKVYRGDRLNRFYVFVLGRLWDEKTQTEYVRIDFQTPMDSAVQTDQRYLLKRATQSVPVQWLYLPALRRVRIVPYQPYDPLLHSDFLFYDLTTIHNFADYSYRFVDLDEQTPQVTAEPRSALVPYHQVTFSLERRGETYLVTEVTATTEGSEKQARFAEFIEIAPGRFRPHKLIVSQQESRTEFTFTKWALVSLSPQLFTPVQLETQTLRPPQHEQ
jgi:hypothetical protein